MRLHQLGWDTRFAAAFTAIGDPALAPARVGIELNHWYRVLTDEGELMAQVAGRLRHRAAAADELPAVGDWVAVSVAGPDRMATIRAVLPRRSCFARKAAGDPTAKQVVAANIDVVLIVSGLDDDFNPKRIGRYLVATADSGARPVVVLNKADLRDDIPSRIAEVRALASDVPIHATCGRTGAGLDAVAAYLEAGRTMALLGSSGVGKSSIINHLLGEARQQTREVRTSDSRGRHTTIHRELLVCPSGGVIIDTPGMRELQVWDTHRSVENAFSEIDALATQCRFRDCEHRREPACAVRAAVADGQLTELRLSQYHQMLDERTALDARRAELEALAERRRTRPPRPKGRR